MIILRSKLFSLNSMGEEQIIIECSNGPIILKKAHPIKPVQWLGKIFKSIRNSQEKALYYDAYIGNNKIGDVALGEQSPIEMMINWIGIDKAYRGKYYATEILKYFINFARSKKYRAITLEWDGNDPVAIDIYKKLGFVEDKTIPTDKSLTFMRKIL